MKGDARKAVKALFAGYNSAQDIMESVEACFGNSRIISSHIISNIRELSRVNPQKISCVDFATNLRNSIRTIRGLITMNYLQNSKLVNEFL